MELIRREDALRAIDSVSALSVNALLIKTACYAVVKTDSKVPSVDAVEVVRCHACEKCTLLEDGIGFHCQAWDTEFYAPHYDVATYYCADGKRRSETCT